MERRFSFSPLIFSSFPLLFYLIFILFLFILGWCWCWCCYGGTLHLVTTTMCILFWFCRMLTIMMKVMFKCLFTILFLASSSVMLLLLDFGAYFSWRLYARNCQITIYTYDCVVCILWFIVGLADCLRFGDGCCSFRWFLVLGSCLYVYFHLPKNTTHLLHIYYHAIAIAIAIAIGIAITRALFNKQAHIRCRWWWRQNRRRGATNIFLLRSHM